MENDRNADASRGAADALADVARTRSAVADRLVTPVWYHPILGASLAALIIGLAQESLWIQLALSALALLAIVIIVRAYQRITGLWVDTRNLGPRGRRLYRTYLGLVLLCLAAAFIPVGTLWLGAGAAVLIFVATVVMGRHLDVLLREEIRDGSAAMP
ncbi:MAG: hypothetical protein WBG57_12220 [Ornithinimicrobium sp.]